MPTEEKIRKYVDIAENFDPADATIRPAAELRDLAHAVDEIQAGEAKVRELVELARARGRSWGQIGIALGVSRQAARERFREKVEA